MEVVIPKFNISKTSVRKPTTEELFHSIVYEAPLLPGDDETTFDIKDIPWADVELFKEGQLFVRNNYFAVSMIHIIALLCGFSFKPMTSVLIRTGGFGLGNKTQSMLRHIRTGLHINRWYETKNMTEIFNDIQIVRKLHFNALRKSQQTPIVLMDDDDVPNKSEKYEIMEALKKDLDDCVETKDVPRSLFTYNQQVFLSQYDMLMTQFGFIFGIVLFPKNLGVRDTQGIRGFLHVWAILGKMLGIQDRFNLALDLNRDLFRIIFNQIAVAHLKDMDLTILHMQQTLVDALSPVFKVMTLKSVFYGALLCDEALPNFKTNHFYKILSWKDWFFAQITRFFNRLIYHSDVIRIIANILCKIANNQNQQNVLTAKKYHQKSIKSFSLIHISQKLWEFVQVLSKSLYKV